MLKIVSAIGAEMPKNNADADHIHLFILKQDESFHIQMAIASIGKDWIKSNKITVNAMSDAAGLEADLINVVWKANMIVDVIINRTNGHSR